MVFLSVKHFNIISGMIIIILSIMLLVYSAATIISILVILAILMIFSGITQVFNTKSDFNLEGTNRIVKYLIGAFELIIGIVLIFSLTINPIATAVFSIRLFGLVILLIGLGMLYVGSMNHDYSKQYRSLLMIIGLITMIFGIIILIIPTVGFTLVTIIIAVPLLFNGIIRFLKGFFN
jgi:uncharacterized membrane protein HdeD (DUF308 family)